VPSFSIKDMAAGMLFVAIGLFFLVGALSLDMGTAFKMGPGYVPLVLSGILIALGIAIGVKSFTTPNESIGTIPWRGLVLVLAAPVIFGATVRGLGLVAALAISVFVTTFASRRMTVPLAIGLTLALTVFCVLVFSYGLGLPLRLKGPWLPF
jgi:putative tricarboxylic transport membrane protein